LTMKLKPSITLSDVFGPDIVFCPRVSPNACTWVNYDNPHLDLLTGAQLAMSGTMPFLCARTVSTKDARQLLKDTGLQLPEELYQHGDGNDYLQELSKLCRAGKKITLQHMHTANDVALENCWIPPSTLSFVNNKAHYREIIDDTYLPSRTILRPNLILKKLSSSPLPIVIKPATDETTGGGLNVFICQKEQDLDEAEKKFRACPRIVAEEFIEINRNLCLNYAVTAAGRIIYLGSAEQVIDAEGKYMGNWIDSKSNAPPNAVELGRHLAQKGFERGYWGFVGIDMAVQDDGGIIVFDLNFRVNGSACALVLTKVIRQVFGQPVIRLGTLVGKSSYREALKSVYKALERKLMVPIASYDPTAGKYSGTPRVLCLILGQTREEVEENQRQIAEWGFSEESIRVRPR